MAQPCSICRSPQRAEIEKALLTQPLRTIERQFQVNKTSLWRHKKHAAAALAKAIETREIAHGEGYAERIREEIAKAHYYRDQAEQEGDYKTAIKGIDTALKALDLYGRATGQISDRRAPSLTVNVVATRDEGIQTAAELLLELASRAELVLLIGQLQQRLAELEPFPEVPETALLKTAESPQPQLLAAPTPEKKEEEEDG